MELSIGHYARVIAHRWWLVLGSFVLFTTGTVFFSSRLPNVYSSETVILVDPQKVPESYVRSTVTGDVRNRLGTLSQQILSVTRLQKIIDTLNLYPEDKKAMAREDIITRMRRDISVNVLSEFGANQDLQAFRITYSGKEPRLVAQVTNELASLFIEENLKAREQQATGTTEFLQNQLEQTRKALEIQEGKLRDFKLKHLGEMPEQQTANLQILGQLQSQMHLEIEALNRTEQQKNYIQSLIGAQSTSPVVDLDALEPGSVRRETQAPKQQQAANNSKLRLEALLTRYSEEHPDVKRLKKQIEEDEAKQAKQTKEEPSTPVTVEPAVPAAPVKRGPLVPGRYFNPILESQLRAMDPEIAKHREEQQRLSKEVSRYQAKLEAIPVHEQQIADLVRDYEISKGHYKQLLEKQLSAETATQLEIRQKGERFSVLDPAQPAERPSRPNRALMNMAGSAIGLGLGLLLALISEFLGISITSPDQITAATGFAVLEVIPVIRTRADRLIRRRRLVLAAISAGVAVLGVGVTLLYHYRDRVF